MCLCVCVCVRARARVKIHKLSLVALVEGFHYYRIEDPDVDPCKKAAAFLEAHCTLLMMILTLMIPQLLGLVSNLRECCYKAKHNNPYPSWTASFWIFVATLFESTGLSLFVLVVAPRIYERHFCTAVPVSCILRKNSHGQWHASGANPATGFRWCTAPTARSSK